MEQLIIEESRHEALEEMYFWPAVRDHLESGSTLADEATGQEQDAKRVVPLVVAGRAAGPAGPLRPCRQVVSLSNSARTMP